LLQNYYNGLLHGMRKITVDRNRSRFIITFKIFREYPWERESFARS